MTIPLDAAIANLPTEVQEALRRGEEVILTRNDAPIARIVPVAETKPFRRANPLPRDEMEKQVREAMADPHFIADMRETQAVFSAVDAQEWPVFDKDNDEAIVGADSVADGKKA